MKGSPFFKRLWPAMSGLSILLFLAQAPGAYGQTMTTGDIVGTVTDASGAVVPRFMGQPFQLSRPRHGRACISSHFTASKLGMNG